MPLTRYEIVGHDQERMAFRFTMLNDDHVVQCQISDAALDDLAGTRGTDSEARTALFASLRDSIERIASQLFDQASTHPGYVVRIFSKHISRAPDGGTDCERK